MKTLNRFILSAGLVMVFSSWAMATNAARQAKSSFTTPFSLVPSSVTTFTVLESTSGIKKPGAVYQVTLSSGASSEFLVMFDSTTSVGLSATVTTNPAAPQLGPRLLFGSTTASTVYTFDPPLIFYNGLMVIDSAITGQGTITYEEGRGVGAQ